MGEDCCDINEIQNIKVYRYDTCINDLNWIFGTDDINDIYKGIPQYSLTICAGEAGVGKTRLWAGVCNSMVNYGLKVLYFQLEMNNTQFKTNYFNNSIFPEGKFIISNATDLSAQCQIIKQENPHIVIVDSINKIDNFNSGRGTTEIEKEYRKAITNNAAAVIFLAHLNQNGSVKGGTNALHLGDIVIELTKSTTRKKSIDVKVGKTRYGQSDRSAIFLHTNTGVECITENYKTNGEDVVFKNQNNFQQPIIQVEPILDATPIKKIREKRNILAEISGADGQGNFLQRFIKGKN